MPGVIHGVASFPGVISVSHCAYTIGHGISPATATLVMLPQTTLPAQFGDLLISDGNQFVTLPNCRLDALNVQQGDSGTTWILSIADLALAVALGSIFGEYNQLDPHGKLIPWTIRSPTELAVLCLAAMGEVNYTLNLPPGLPQSAGQGLTQFLPGGLNFPPTGVNPPINWDGLPPAQALQQLADLFNCRVIYRLDTNSILVSPPGVGALLPITGLSLHAQGPSLKSPEAPDSVTVTGSPTRFQMQLDLEAVGEDWDGMYRPIKQLSYAPANCSPTVEPIPAAALLVQRQVYKATFAASGAAGVKFTLTLYDKTVSYTTAGGASGATVASGFKALIDQAIAANDATIKQLSATAVGTLLTVTTVGDSGPFDCDCRITSAAPVAGNSVINAVPTLWYPGGRSWVNCSPPDFWGVRAVPGRLTVFQSQALAQKSVFKTYRMSGDDIETDKPPIKVPGYGTVQRIQQLVLQETQVEQVVPLPLDATVKDQNGIPLIVNYYNGYSKDKPAAAYGSVVQNFLANGVVVNNNADINTPEGKQIFIPFSTDSVLGQITFSDFAFHLHVGLCYEPIMTLQTAVLVRDGDTNALIRYTQNQQLPGPPNGTAPLVRVYPDIQLGIIGGYDTNGKLVETRTLDQDAQARAKYYLDGMAAQFILSGGQVAEYNGVVAIALDGAIQQVTWEVGENGCKTTASRNTEHSILVSPYPVRRFRELLAPDQTRFIEEGRNVLGFG